MLLDDLSFQLWQLTFKWSNLRNTLNEVDLDAEAKQCAQQRKYVFITLIILEILNHNLDLKKKLPLHAFVKSLDAFLT